MNIAGGRETVKHLRPLAVLLLALCAGSKLLLSGGVELGKDEAAYVYWSQHLDATYALLPFALFGFFHWLAPGSEWVLRMGPILTGTLSLLLVYRLCRQHNLSQRAALMAAAALGSCHWFWHTTSFLHPDGPLVTCWLLTLVTAQRCWGGERSARWRDLILVGACAGLTLLCKYSAAFLVTGLVAWIAIARRDVREVAWVAAAAAVVAAPLLQAQLASGLFLPTTLSTLSRIATDDNPLVRLTLFVLSPALFASPLFLYEGYRVFILRLADLRDSRSPDHNRLLLSLLPGLCLILAFAGFALLRGQIKGNWILPTFLALLPAVFAATTARRRLFLWGIVGTNLAQALAFGVALRFPTLVQELAPPLQSSGIDQSYTLLVAAPDRRREAAFSWTERLCDYRGWSGLAAALNSRLAEQSIETAALASDQYGVVFGLAYYAETGGRLRDYRTVDDPRFRDLSDLYAADPAPPPQVLFVARASSALPTSVASRYRPVGVGFELPRAAAGCDTIAYRARLFELR